MKMAQSLIFTGSLKIHIADAGVSISDLMIVVRNDVAQATNGQQIPNRDHAKQHAIRRTAHLWIKCVIEEGGRRPVTIDDPGVDLVSDRERPRHARSARVQGREGGVDRVVRILDLHRVARKAHGENRV